MSAIIVLPVFLASFVERILGPWISPLKKYLRRADQHLGVLVTERLRTEEELGNNYPGRPVPLSCFLVCHLLNHYVSERFDQLAFGRG